MIMNGVKINSIKELKKNFSIDELTNSYFSGELEIFLNKIGEKDKAVEISKISTNNAFLLIKLYQILEIEPKMSEQDIRSSVF